MKNNKNVRKDNLSPVENGSKRIYKMYKSKKNWVVAPVVLLTLLGAVAPAPIALTNVVNAEGETPATTTTSSSEATTADSGATPEKDNTVAPVEATIAAKKDAIFAIQNLELPKSLTAAEKEKTHTKNVKFKTQDDFIASINAIADSADTQSVFDVLKSAYTQAAVAAYETFAPKVTSTKEKLAAVNGLEDKVSTDANAQTYLEYFNGKADATQTTVDKALDKFITDLTVKAGEVDRTLGTETKPAENNYQTVRATLDKVLAEQTSALASIYNAAVEQGKINTDYNAKKADAAKRINELPNLTAAERNQYLADINKVAADNDDTRTDESLTAIRDWKTELETIVKNATKTNNQHVTDLIATVNDYLDGKAKDSLNNTIPVYLTAKAVTDYKSKVNSFAKLTEVRGIDTNLNKVSDLQALFDTIKKANEDATVSYKLNSLKQQYIAAINNKDDADYALLSEPTRQAYVHRISDSAVTTSAQVRDIFAEYKDELEVAKLLHDNATLDALKNAGYDKVKDLTNIDDLVKGNYQFAIKSASTKDEVVSIFKEALAANRAALRAAQDAAIKDINALPFLSDAEKKDYAAEITRDFNADGTIRNITLDNVATIRTEAINKNAAAELKAAKYDAKKTVQGLKYLSNTVVGSYLDKIEAATSVKNVQTIVAEAIKANFTAGVENALTVKEAQEIATEAINTLDALTAAEKADALKDVADAKTKEDVLKAYQAADKTNTANIEAAARAAQLAKEKEAAIKAINAFKYLTSDQKSDYVAKVKAAANSDDVKDVLSKATNDDKIGFEAFKQLEAAKTNAVKLIRGDYDKGETAGYETSAYKSDITTFGSLVYLTNEQKADYVAKILAAKSIAEVDKLVDDAYYTNLNQITDRSEFNKVASELINASKYLNPSQKAGYVSNLVAAKDIDAAKKVLKEAVDKGYEQNDKLVMKEIDSLLKSGLYNTAKTKLAALRLDSNISTYTAKVQGLLDLREAKEKAVNEITGADYVSDKDKENLINSVNKATSVADVNKVLDQLKDLQPATVVQLYRAYNPNSGEHLYTADKAEYDKLVGLGWHGEGNAWKAASKGAPVYRLYNPNSGEHFYTISESEYNDVAKAGWKKEGVAFYSDANRGVEVFRLFNPNAKGAGSHHYTTLASERDDLIKAGWKYENVAFYGLK